MDKIILTNEQIEILRKNGTSLPAFDSNGNLIGLLTREELSAEEIAEIKKRARTPVPRYTGEQVQKRLQALEQEWQRTGGFDEAYMQEYLASSRSQETECPVAPSFGW